MANPTVPKSGDTEQYPLGYGIHDNAGADEAALPRILDAAVIDDETAKSGALAVSSHTDHDAVDVGGPVKIGGRAQSPTAAPDEVADNDRVDALFDRNGRIGVWSGYPVKRAVINTAASGNTTAVAAVAGKRIAVLTYSLQGEGSVDATLQDGAGGTAVTPPWALTSGTFISEGNGGVAPLWIGTSNTLLNINLGAAVQVNGAVTYVEMDD